MSKAKPKPACDDALVMAPMPKPQRENSYTTGFAVDLIKALCC